jgi:hypothetical protein
MTAPAPIPSVTSLGSAGRMFLVTWLEGLVFSDLPVDAAAWRDAWGRAADYQTVVDARRALEVRS